MPLPNGCIYVAGDFDPADFSSADFETGEMVCGPYFVQVQQAFDQVTPQQVYQQVVAQQVTSSGSE
jgi:hypothetical protein